MSQLAQDGSYEATNNGGIVLNRISVTVAFLALIASQASAKAPSCKNGTILESSSNELTPAKINDPIGFCSNHASRDLLHQEICKRASDPKDCFQPAVADFLVEDKKMKPGDRNSDLALREVLARNKVASEECLKLNVLFPTPNKERRYADYGEKFRTSGHKVAWNECLAQGNSPSTCNSNLNSPQFTEYLYDGIAKWKDQKNCEEKELPNLAFKHFRTDRDGRPASENLKRLLKQGNFVKIATKDPHAFVIANYRIVCRKGEQVLEYQTIDSLAGTQWSEVKKMGDWIDGEDLLKELDLNSGFLILEPAPTKPMRDNASETAW